MLYRSKRLVAGLMFSDIFDSKEAFGAKVGSVGGITDLDELYEVLYNKYYWSETRYVIEGAFIHALKFKLQVLWPAYLKEKSLVNMIHELTLKEIIEGDISIVNQVNNPNIPTVNPAYEPIVDLSSTQQTALRKINKLDAIRLQYENSSLEYLRKIYNAVDSLFVQILSENNSYIFPQGGK